MRWIFLIIVGFQVQLVLGQRPTFVKPISYINGNDINWQKGLFQQTDSTYVGIYTASAGSDQQSPYYVIYDLEGNVLKEELIQINIPHFTYIIGDVIQTSDSGIIIHGESDIADNSLHCIKYDKSMNEEWRIVSNKYDSINGTDLVPEHSTSRNDTVYSLSKTDSKGSYYTSRSLNFGHLIDSTSLKAINPSIKDNARLLTLNKVDKTIYFNVINNSGQNPNNWVGYLFTHLNSLTSIKLTENRNSHITDALLLPKKHYLLFRDSISNNYIIDKFDFSGMKKDSILLPFDNGGIEFSNTNYLNKKTTCALRLLSDQFKENGSDKFLDVILKIDSSGNLINYFPVGKLESGNVEASYSVNNIQQFDDGYYAIYLWPTPGVSRTPFYMIVTDSNFYVNGKYFLDYFNSMNIEEQKTEIESFVYPNPSSTEIFIANFKEGSNFSIYDLSGKIKTSGLTRNQIDISNLKEGVYILAVISKKGIIERHKIIKK